MKPTLFTLLFISTSILSYSQEYIDVIFDGNFGNNSQQQVFMPKKAKKDQLSAQTGTSQIWADISNNLNKLDALTFPILEEAVKIWRENLYFIHDSANIVIKFDIMDLPTTTAYRTMTSYCTHSDGLKYPIIFAEAIHGIKPENNQETTIYFNSDPELWYFKGDTDNTIQSDQYDFLTAALRALTQTFGFKASVRDRNTGGIHAGTFVNCFDAKIINTDNVHFQQLNPHNAQQANDFITGDNVYLENIESGSKLYAPQTFERGLSLDYFENDGTLMSHNFTPGSRFWEIDDQTIKAMSSIGWPLKDLDINIVGDTKKRWNHIHA